MSGLVLIRLLHQVGRVWPAAAVFLLLGNIVNNLDLDADTDTQLDNDKAFDKVTK